jgi:hypothetical protein
MACVAVGLLLILSCGGSRVPRRDGAAAGSADIPQAAVPPAAGDDASPDRAAGQQDLGDAAFVPRQANQMPQGGVVRPCSNLECRQASCVMGDCQPPACPGETRTTISGRVFEPAGRVPLPNAIVYVPNAPLAPFPAGASCQRCDSPVSGQAIASALTDPQGRFVIDNAPVGPDVPLVIQIGKWRRQITVPLVEPCANTQVPASLTHLPRNQREGDMPSVALTTGGADPMECLLRKLGIDDAEFTTAGGGGRVHLYAGTGGTNQLSNGTALPSATNFWSSLPNLLPYDVVVLACESAQYPNTKSLAARQALQDYTAQGGRVFASHFHNIWLETGPAPWPSIATWRADINDLANPTLAKIDQTFPKGQALARWLVETGASRALGTLTLQSAQHTLVKLLNPDLVQRSIFAENAVDVDGVQWPLTVQYFTFNTPIAQPEPSQCGRVVFSDMHISAADIPGMPFPRGCVTQLLSPQEMVLVYMLFDLVSCVESQQQPPQPPDLQ